ncbi:MAG: adenylate/guanylate cyclase domain-containing protein, partial [Actinomycetota bacterium]|nr:adenylate/guanylate cyclase domain-containing protein [Actinomycetota bacterium]
MSDLPTGEVTFLFTDVESSTALWEREPETMAVAVAEHDELLHRAVEANGGVVFKGLGDGVCAVFASAGDGVAAAREGQHRLLSHAWPTSEPLRVRMAVHTGVAQLRGGDYFGTALNRTARLMGTAHGGQVVLTQAAACLVEDELRAGTSLLDLGMHRLKDLGRPEHVYQLQHPGLPIEFPLLRSLDLHRGNLPHRATEFIGRNGEIAQVGELVATHRLVTLRGTGGIGKTSLAIRAAAEIVEDFSDGVWLVELAPLTDGDQIPGAVAGLFDVEASASQDVTEILTRHLAGMETLLIVDNCEHVIDGAAAFVDTLLGGTDRVRVLATSREVLRIGGEAVLRVPSLRLPAVDSGVGGIVDAEAVALFVDRAQLVRHGFVVDDTNAEDVIEICRRLDGIPLAIELAAARLDTMTVEQVAECLDDRFRVLTRGSRVAMPRQRTLEALVDWSYDLLTASEQVLLRRLGVFGGSFTPEAVEQVCGFGPLDAGETIDGLDRLTEASLVTPPEPPSDRYHMLETIRAYARRHLDRHGETEETMRRLAAYLLEQGPATRKARPEGDLVEWLQWRADEQDNYRAALYWTREEGDGPLLGALAVDFLRY